mgnify:CR=1 FL=1
MPDPIAVEEHLRRILDAVPTLEPTQVRLLDALGLATAEDVRSGIELPSFDNSAMDGYAVRHADVVAASADAPVHLPVIGTIGAGGQQQVTVEPGTAAKVMTGAPMPPSAQARNSHLPPWMPTAAPWWAARAFAASKRHTAGWRSAPPSSPAAGNAPTSTPRQST